MQNIDGPFFMDGVCPKCGRRCGNGGHGMTLRCQCGWTGGLAPGDAQAMAEFYKRHMERNALAGADQNENRKETT